MIGDARTPDDVAVGAWTDLAARLDRLGRRLDDLGFPDALGDPSGRAATVRHLARQTALALTEQLDQADPRHPRLIRYELPWSQWGAPNPDNVYARAAIDPAADYLVRGRVDGVHEALFSLVEGDMHLDEPGVVDEVALTALDVGDDGEVRLTIGPGPGGPAHLRTDPTARMVMIRQYLYDWETEPVASFAIERADTVGRPAAAVGPDGVAAGLDRAARWVERSIEYWAAYVAASRDLLEHNSFTPPTTPPGGAPSIAYGGGCFDLAPDQALVIEHDRPQAHYWNWSIHHLHWFDSGAWDQRLTSCNGHDAFVDEDGRVRIVVAATDPGVPNWLDTEDRAVGMAVYRYVGATTKPRPTARVVARTDLRASLPSTHPRVSPEARRDQLARRSYAAQRRWS